MDAKKFVESLTDKEVNELLVELNERWRKPSDEFRPTLIYPAFAVDIGIFETRNPKISRSQIGSHIKKMRNKLSATECEVWMLRNGVKIINKKK